MQWTLLLALAIALFSAGCVSKTKSELRAREAFIAGQREAMAKLPQPKSEEVVVQGQVRRSIVPWKEGMTLSQAIYEAEYIGTSDPKRILVVREGQATEVNPQDLLKGTDMVLQRGDIVSIQQ